MNDNNIESMIDNELDEDGQWNNLVATFLTNYTQKPKTTEQFPNSSLYHELIIKRRHMGRDAVGVVSKDWHKMIVAMIRNEANGDMVNQNFSPTDAPGIDNLKVKNWNYQSHPDIVNRVSNSIVSFLKTRTTPLTSGWDLDDAYAAVLGNSIGDWHTYTQRTIVALSHVFWGI